MTKARDLKARYSGRIQEELIDGMAVVFGDCHYWPGDDSTAHRALVQFVEHYHPELVVCNGDAFDGASISRHPRLGYSYRPTVAEELEVVKAKLGEIEDVSKGKLRWTLGNHDWRFETILAAAVPQMEGVWGMSLKDHFPRWTPCWSVIVNGDTKIKHREKGGVHAVYNNVLHEGINVITNHLHHPGMVIFRDSRGARYGQDTGCIAAVGAPQFDYLEDNTVNWTSGFSVLTFRNGKLLPPEYVQVIDEGEGVVCFRGELITV